MNNLVINKISKNTILLLFLFISKNAFCQKSTASKQITTFELKAPQLQNSKKIWIYLPQNYLKTKKKYPVLYIHDGQNLFDKQTAFADEWNVDEKLDSINAQVIVVGIEHGNEKRLEELTPFKNEKYGGGNATNYLDFITKTLKPEIDKRYRTKTNKHNTLIIGSSLGGLTSYFAILKYPEVFGKAAVFSPSFWINRNEIFELTQNTKIKNQKIYFLCGDKEDDGDMITDLNKIEYLINSQRCYCLNLNKKTIIKNGQHNEKLWKDNFIKSIKWLL